MTKGRIGGHRKTRIVRSGRILVERLSMVAVAVVAAGAVAEGEGAEPEPGLPELHVLSGFRNVDDESWIDIMNRNLGTAGIVLTFLDGDEDRRVWRLSRDVGVTLRRRQ